LIALAPFEGRPPPGQPLFPYTTLFRSLAARARRICRTSFTSRAIGTSWIHIPLTAKRNQPHTRATLRQRWDVGLRASSFLRQKADRKSTRLNSSHVAISYAVFCLKKKR